jgi:multidrug transporter EmrE-like cation transporter
VAAVLAVVWGAQGSVGVGVLLGSAENLLSGIGIGVFGTLGAFALMLLATRYISPLEVGLASGFEAVFAGLLAAWWFGERLSALQLLGAALVIAGVSLTYICGECRAKAPNTGTSQSPKERPPLLGNDAWEGLGCSCLDGAAGSNRAGLRPYAEGPLRVARANSSR